MRVDEAAPFIIVNSDWGVSTVLGAYKLGMVIDLSYKDRGYERAKFEAAGVTHVKIPIPGKRVISDQNNTFKSKRPLQIPSEEQVQKFFHAVDDFFEENDDDKLLGVHSTFGGNRSTT